MAPHVMPTISYDSITFLGTLLYTVWLGRQDIMPLTYLDYFGFSILPSPSIVFNITLLVNFTVQSKAENVAPSV